MNLRFTIDDLRTCGARDNGGLSERLRAGDIAAGRRPALPPSLRYGAAGLRGRGE